MPSLCLGARGFALDCALGPPRCCQRRSEVARGLGAKTEPLRFDWSVWFPALLPPQSLSIHSQPLAAIAVALGARPGGAAACRAPTRSNRRRAPSASARRRGSPHVPCWALATSLQASLPVRRPQLRTEQVRAAEECIRASAGAAACALSRVRVLASAPLQPAPMCLGVRRAPFLPCRQALGHAPAIQPS